MSAEAQYQVGERATSDSRENVPHPSNHARMRWFQRAGVTEFDIREAWYRSPSVGVPDYVGTKGRLHEPSGTVLIARDGVIVTVVYTGDERLNDDHLCLCDRCGYRYDRLPDDRECQWCRDNRASWSAALEVVFDE